MAGERAVQPVIGRILAISDRVSVAVGALSALLLVAIAAMILSEIVARAAFNISLSFAWEYSSYCMAVAIFCGASYALRTGAHVRVSLLTANVSPRLARGIDIAATVAGLAITVFIAVAMTEMAVGSWAGGSRSATSVATPLVVPQGGIAFGCALFALQLAARLVRLLIGEPPELAVAADLKADH